MEEDKERLEQELVSRNEKVEEEKEQEQAAGRTHRNRNKTQWEGQLHSTINNTRSLKHSRLISRLLVYTENGWETDTNETLLKLAAC